jgi:SAM-dependent methyltransferase
MTKYQQIAKRISSASRVLDVGCGAGDLDRSLLGKQCSVIGWDLTLDRIGDSADSYTLLAERNVEKEGQGGEKNDALVFSDVLEHLNDAGKVILSLPNVAYFENRLRIFMGSWDYTDDGILDHTHIRFYTLKTAQDLIADAVL